MERLVERGPEMFMDPAEEKSSRKVALEESVTDAVTQGLSVSKVKSALDFESPLQRLSSSAAG